MQFFPEVQEVLWSIKCNGNEDVISILGIV